MLSIYNVYILGKYFPGSQMYNILYDYMTKPNCFPEFYDVYSQM